MKASVKWCAVVVVGLAVLVPWFATRTATAPPSPAAAATSPAAAKVSAASTANTATASPSPSGETWPPREIPFAEQLAQTQAASEAGNAAAQMELTRLLAECTPRGLHTARSADRYDLAMLEENRHNAKITDEHREDVRRNLQRQIDRNAEIRAVCGTLPKAVVTNWLDPLDQAARSGDIGAMREYARRVSAEYQRVEDVAADVDNAIVRRDKARAHVAEALRRGDAGALLDLATAYNEDSSWNSILYTPDPAKACAYAYAGLQQPGIGDYERDQLEQIVAQNTRHLDARALADAQAEGKRIYERCCSAR